MPINRKTNSLLGKAIVDDVAKFIQENAENMDRDVNLTSKEAAEPLAHAICYAISKALSNGKIKIAFDFGIVPPTVGGSPGPLIYNNLKSQVIEL